MMIPEATMIGLVTACDSDGFTGKRLYVVEGQPGWFRRVARTSRGLKASADGNVVAHEGDEILELRKWPALDVALAASGYYVVGSELINEAYARAAEDEESAVHDDEKAASATYDGNK